MNCGLMEQVSRTSSQVVCSCKFSLIHVSPSCLSDTLTRSGSRGSSSSTSTASQVNSPMPPSHEHHDFQHPSTPQHFDADLNGESSDDEEAADESRDLPAVYDISQQQRPLSSVSFSSRYRTPLAGSFTPSSPPLRRTSVPPMQPLPNFETPSAFADPQTTPSAYTPSASYTAPSSSRALTPQIQSIGSSYRSLPMTSRHNSATTVRPRPPSRTVSVSLEHAMENMQAHLAALTERIDTLELSLVNHSQPQAQSSTSSLTSSGRGSPAGSRSVRQPFEWGVDDMGLWALVLKPLFRNLSLLRRFVVFFLTSDQDRSPLLIVVRRLCLDISFLMVVVGVLRTVWKRSGARRKEVGAALVVLWRAVAGKRRIPGGSNLKL